MNLNKQSKSMLEYMKDYVLFDDGYLKYYRRNMSNGLTIFLKIDNGFKVTNISIFETKDVTKYTNSDSIPPKGSTAFHISMMAKQYLIQYENIPNIQHFSGMMVKISLS